MNYHSIRRSTHIIDTPSPVSVVSCVQYPLVTNLPLTPRLQASDVSGTLSLLKDCATFYHGGQLQADCAARPCAGVPDRCARHDAVYHLLHYVLDNYFLPPRVRIRPGPAGVLGDDGLGTTISL